MTHSKLPKVRRVGNGFTIVELMLVVATISLLAVIGIPSYQRARKRSQTGVLMNELRTTADAFQIFVSETRNLPPSSPDLSVIPEGMETYLPSMSTWTTQLPGGGFWYWVRPNPAPPPNPPAEIWGFSGVIGIYNPSFTPEQLEQIDTTMDDGNASTGGIRSSTDGWVYLGVK